MNKKVFSQVAWHAFCIINIVDKEQTRFSPLLIALVSHDDEIKFPILR